MIDCLVFCLYVGVFVFCLNHHGIPTRRCLKSFLQTDWMWLIYLQYIKLDWCDGGEGKGREGKGREGKEEERNPIL